MYWNHNSHGHGIFMRKNNGMILTLIKMNCVRLHTDGLEYSSIKVWANAAREFFNNYTSIYKIK